MTDTLQLSSSHMVCIQDGRDIRIEVLQGEVVVTCEQDPEDHDLIPGHAFHIDRPGKTIAKARLNSVVRLALESARAPRANIAVKKYVGPRPIVVRTLEWPRRRFFGRLLALKSAVA
jgi:hypothetical protein